MFCILLFIIYSLMYSYVSSYPLSFLQVFCSQWLSDHQIAMGTKCNKLMVYDVNTRQMDVIPALCSPEVTRPPEQQQCGIHSIEINPSRTLLATGALNSNDIAVYRLPTLDPVCWVVDVGGRDGFVCVCVCVCV